ncbi:glycerophosphodiester phosphodiesterase family protein [Ruicaihuangia caeni]|uniref:Glycerophosphodiester phosphodiesterase family protein n=1 Tax=Ruicaihuangia caeni TaxID=3042517 RepID=A0AAW6T696_9MICO|nr:glycerophosphodiester phosphodiesterase family protein [Klugiella sp. YN-L-19]MDI2098201.1 glycerophosphodiester phosphodiesterase family protein [Klugiella sp. YN-L-19]
MYFSPEPPRVLAHRGFSLEAPENTLLAFAKAIAAGCTHIETDTRATADGVAVLCHDRTLERVAGEGRRVSSCTMDELRAIDLGEGQGFCSLEEALNAFPETRFNIDIKSADAVGPTVAAIIKAKAIDRVLVTSFDEGRRLKAVNMLPGVATSAASRSLGVALIAAKLGLGQVVRMAFKGIGAVQAPERAGRLKVTTRRVIRAWQRAGLEVHIWTVNDQQRMRELLDLGVDGIVTDRPDLAFEVLRERGQHRP